MQSDSLDATSLLHSDSINMLVDPPISSAATTTAPACSTSSIPQSISSSFISIPFHRLSKPHRRCSVCSTYFSETKSSSSQIGNYVRARAFLEHNVLVSFGSRCCDKHISCEYLNSGALQIIKSKDEKHTLDSEELIDHLGCYQIRTFI